MRKVAVVTVGTRLISGPMLTHFCFEAKIGRFQQFATIRGYGGVELPSSIVRLPSHAIVTIGETALTKIVSPVIPARVPSFLELIPVLAHLGANRFSSPHRFRWLYPHFPARQDGSDGFVLTGVFKPVDKQLTSSLSTKNGSRCCCPDQIRQKRPTYLTPALSTRRSEESFRLRKTTDLVKGEKWEWIIDW